MLIRQETSADYEQVYQLVTEAFKSAEHSDGKEQDLVAELRKGEAFVPELSLVAEIDGKIVGHILFTEGKVGSDTVLVLAPLSVSPEFQQQGVGNALMKEGHNIAQNLGYTHSVVLGSETYYPRAGYVPAEQIGIEIPAGIPSPNFMARSLQESKKTIGGSITYAKEFEKEGL